MIDRRKFIRLGLIVAAAAMVPFNALAADNESVPEVLDASEVPEASETSDVSESSETSEVRDLHFYNVNSREDLKITYWKDGWYIPEALSEINHIFRDSRTGKVKPIKKELLDLLYNVRQNVDFDKPFQIVSGYRTPRSNAILRRRKRGVAKNSLHMYGKAVDIRVPGVSLRKLKREVKKLEQGGVGYYPRANFLHVDIGEVRYWKG